MGFLIFLNAVVLGVSTAISLIRKQYWVQCVMHTILAVMATYMLLFSGENTRLFYVGFLVTIAALVSGFVTLMIESNKASNRS